jgi:D-arabinose 5-phosphate isomerase GutQ
MELLQLLPHIPSTIPVIAITSHMDVSSCPILSSRPHDKAVLLPAPIHESEQTSFGVCAPTTSTTVALSIGDALAIAIAKELYNSPGRCPMHVFKGYHPAGVHGTT